MEFRFRQVSASDGSSGMQRTVDLKSPVLGRLDPLNLKAYALMRFDHSFIACERPATCPRPGIGQSNLMVASGTYILPWLDSTYLTASPDLQTRWSAISMTVKGP
jgi:hypothetical protein